MGKMIQIQLLAGKMATETKTNCNPYGRLAFIRADGIDAITAVEDPEIDGLPEETQCAIRYRDRILFVADSPRGIAAEYEDRTTSLLDKIPAPRARSV